MNNCARFCFRGALNGAPDSSDLLLILTGSDVLLVVTLCSLAGAKQQVFGETCHLQLIPKMLASDSSEMSAVTTRLHGITSPEIAI
jgi:hypothetical protein